MTPATSSTNTSQQYGTTYSFFAEALLCFDDSCYQRRRVREDVRRYQAELEILGNFFDRREKHCTTGEKCANNSTDMSPVSNSIERKRNLAAG